MNFDPHDPINDSRPSPPALYCKVQRVEAPLTGMFGLNCRQYARLTVAAMDRRLTRGEQVRHVLHGAMCGMCRQVSGQFNAISELIRESGEPAASGEKDRAAAERIARQVRELVEKQDEGAGDTSEETGSDGRSS